MGNVCVRIMTMNSERDRIIYEEERGPSTCPNEFRSECTISEDLFKGKVFTPHGGRLLYFFFCWSRWWFAAGPAMPAREERCCPKSPADNMWAEIVP